MSFDRQSKKEEEEYQKNIRDEFRGYKRTQRSRRSRRSSRVVERKSIMGNIRGLGKQED